MNTLIVASFSFLAAVIGAVATFMVAKRMNSGEIDTSDAAQLWLEGQAMRRDLRDEVVVLRDKVNTLEGTRTEYRDLIVVLRSKVGEMAADAQIMQEKIIRLEMTVAAK